MNVQKVSDNSGLRDLKSETLARNEPSAYEQSLFDEAYARAGERGQGYQEASGDGRFGSDASLGEQTGDERFGSEGSLGEQTDPICHESLCRLQGRHPQGGDSVWQKNEGYALQGRSEAGAGPDEGEPSFFAAKDPENLGEKAERSESSLQEASDKSGEGSKEGAKGAELSQKQGETKPLPDAQSPFVREEKLLDKKSESLGETKETHKAQDTEQTLSPDAQKNVACAAPLPSADTLMESLFAQQMLAPTETAGEASQLSSEMTELVERILVAEPSKGEQEVRITLADGLLKDAELSILRNADGQLNVRVSCTNVNAFQTAVSARQSLVEALESHGERVEVVIDRGESRDGNEGDSRQRSRGLQTLSWEPDNA